MLTFFFETDLQLENIIHMFLHSIPKYPGHLKASLRLEENNSGYSVWWFMRDYAIFNYRTFYKI